MLDYIHQYVAEHRRSPFIREIQAGCQIVSYKSTIDRLIALERKGYIKRAPNKHRGILLHRKAHELAKARAEAAAGQAGLRNDGVETLA